MRYVQTFFALMLASAPASWAAAIHACDAPVPVEAKTWARIKATYR